MVKNAHMLVSLVILILGMALLGRSLAANGAIVLSTHVIAGGAFIIYGSVRLYYLWGAE